METYLIKNMVDKAFVKHFTKQDCAYLIFIDCLSFLVKLEFLSYLLSFFIQKYMKMT